MPSGTKAEQAAAAPVSATYREVPIEHIKVDEGFNNRRALGDLDELAASIKSVGLLQPLTVYALGPMEVHVIAGHRRLAAAAKAGLKFVPCLVQELDERGRLEALLVENLHRLDIDPLEEADGYQRLVTLGLNQHEIAAKVGRSQAHVSKRLALQGLGKAAAAELNSGGITLEQAADFAKYEVRIQDTVIKAAKKDYGGIRRHFQYQSPAHEAKAIVEREALAKRKAETRKKAKEEGVELLKGTFATDRWLTEYVWQRRPERPLDHKDLKGHVKLADHRKLACHRGYIDTAGKLHYACSDPGSHLPKAEAKKLQDAARPEQDSYEVQRRKRENLQRELKAAQEGRLPAVREALQALNRPLLTRFALEALVMSGNSVSTCSVLGLDTKKRPPQDVLADYCNASEANLLRAGAAVAIVLGDHALASRVEAEQLSYYVDPRGVGHAYSSAEWFEAVGIELSGPEKKVVASIRKAAEKASRERPPAPTSRERMEAIADEEGVVDVGAGEPASSPATDETAPSTSATAVCRTCGQPESEERFFVENVEAGPLCDLCSAAEASPARRRRAKEAVPA